MKTKLFKSSVSFLLVMLLCVSLIAPTFASAQNVTDLAPTGTDESIIVEKHWNNPKISRNEVIALFEGIGSGSYYGIAQGFDADTGSVTYMQSLLNNNVSVTAGGYTIFRTAVASGSMIKKPDWSAATKQNVLVKLYYTADFFVVGSADGALYLNGEEAGEKANLFPDEEYTVTAKAVDDFTCAVSGVAEGEAFSPSSDLTITATYTPDASANVALNVGEGGTAAVLCDGAEAADSIAAGKLFSVTASANTTRGYELDSIVVLKDGEAVEADENGMYGPVADGENYEITVSFKFNPQRVTSDVDANKAEVSRADLNTLFDGAYNYYGIAPATDPDKITYLAIALTSDYAVEADVEYYIYGTNEGNILSPKWTNATLKVFTARTYYNGTFTVKGHEDGEILLNGEAVNGAVKLYTDTAYTITAKDIPEYISTVYGAAADVEFTPAKDIEVTAEYIKDTYAVITVNPYEGGTVEIVSDGETVYEKLAEGKSFEIKATADALHDYYIDSIVVTKDGEVVEADEDGKYGPVADGESYEVSVTFAKATLTLTDSEVILIDIKNKKYDEVVHSIIKNAKLSPAVLANEAEFKVEYAAYTILGTDIYVSLDYTGALSHAFGTSKIGGELLDGNTEHVKVTCNLPAYGIELVAYATATVKDVREATSVDVESGTTTITYGDDLKAAIFDKITVYDSRNRPIDFSYDDITLEPESLNVKLLSAQEVTVRYNGNDYYAVSEGTASVYVKQAKGSIDTKSEIITYGETPAAEIRTTPEGLDYIRVIGGVDGDASGFVSIDIPQSLKDRMEFNIANVISFSMYDALKEAIGDGVSPGELRTIINNLYALINSSDALREMDGCVLGRCELHLLC